MIATKGLRDRRAPPTAATRHLQPLSPSAVPLLTPRNLASGPLPRQPRWLVFRNNRRAPGIKGEEAMGEGKNAKAHRRADTNPRTRSLGSRPESPRVRMMTLAARRKGFEREARTFPNLQLCPDRKTMRFGGADGLAGRLDRDRAGTPGRSALLASQLGRGTFARAALGGVGALGCCGRGRRTDLSGPGGRRLLTGNRYEYAGRLLTNVLVTQQRRAMSRST